MGTESDSMPLPESRPPRQQKGERSVKNLGLKEVLCKEERWQYLWGAAKIPAHHAL